MTSATQHRAPPDQTIERPRDGAAAAGSEAAIGHLLLFFSLVYVVEGLGQVVGLISQPLTYYLKEVHGWTPVQVTAFLTVFNLPWIIKPLYGMVSDFLPLFGYRRKSYLIVANIAAIAGYFWVTRLIDPTNIAFALMLTAYAMAISSTLCGAVLVEQGQRLSKCGTFVNQQWLWYNIAAMAAAIVGGQLVQRLPPAAALHVAAVIVGCAPFAVIGGTMFLISEPKSKADLQGMKHTFHGLMAAFQRRHLWIVAAFVFFYYFSPGMSTALYYHMTDDLKFSQGFIGILGSIGSAGWVLGALVYRKFFGDLTLKHLLNLSIAIGTVASLLFLLFWNEPAAAVISFCAGFAAMLATVATLTLAADYCPKRAEGFSFAILMSIINLATTVSDNVGSYLYTHLFHRSLPPLIVISALFTALAFVVVPLLRLGDKRQGEPVEMRERMEPAGPGAR